MYMNKLSLSVAYVLSDRVHAIHDGRVEPNGIQVHSIPVENVGELFSRAIQNREFDVSELSMAAYLQLLDQGEHAYRAIPVFTSRKFRHSNLFIHTDAGIEAPEDLAGKRVGIPAYAITSNVWIRGMLADEYDVLPREIEWVRGRQSEFLPIDLPDDIELRQSAADEPLDDLLVAGEIDAIAAPSVPSAYADAAEVERLFEQYWETEREYFVRTGHFPIMHTVAIKEELVNEHEELPRVLFNAFETAKEVGLRRLEHSINTGLPWIQRHVEETQSVMGRDYWPYGLEENRRELETLIRYAGNQGLIDSPLDVDQLFYDVVGNQ